jgi:hypothetical protein
MEGAFKNKMIRAILSFLLLLFFIDSTSGSDSAKLCKAVSKGNFNKVERIVKRHVNGLPESKESESGVPTYLSMDQNIDSLRMWFKRMECVDDAFYDKCQNKISIYPGWSIIGVKFKTNSGLEEKCFSIQKGTTGTINIFGWKLKVARMKSKLVFKKLYDCTGFIEEQKQNCFKK